MANFEQWITQDLHKPVQAIYSQSLAFSADNDSIMVGVHVTDDGEPATLSGTVVARVIRSADGGTVTFTGSRSGSDISAMLPAACFAYPGQIAVMLQLVDGTTKTTLCKVLYSVVQGATGIPIDPGSVVPDLADILAELDDMAAATAAAEAAAEAATSASAFVSLLAPLQTTATASQAYAAGAYFVYSGKLYVATEAIASGGTIVPGTNCKEAILGDDVTALRISNLLQNDDIIGTTQAVAFDASGNLSTITHTANGSAVRTDVFTYGIDTITEVRTLYTGETLTITANTSTLVTTVVYSAA